MSECIMCKNEVGVFQRIHLNCYNKRTELIKHHRNYGTKMHNENKLKEEKIESLKIELHDEQRRVLCAEQKLECYKFNIGKLSTFLRRLNIQIVVNGIDKQNVVSNRIKKVLEEVAEDLK